MSWKDRFKIYLLLSYYNKKIYDLFSSDTIHA